MYKILGADQKEYGPVSAEVVRQWIAQRRANAQTRVRPEGSTDWKPLSEFPEFKDALAAATVPPGLPGSAPSPIGVPVTSPKTSALAITSLMLGILGFCGVTSLLALILGTISLIKIGNSAGRLTGKGFAITGMCLSGFFLLMLPALMLPALAKAKSRAQAISCSANLKQVGLAARMYAADHQDTFPEDFQSMSNELFNTKILVCPSDAGKTKAADFSSLTPQNISYELVSPGIKDELSAASKVLARCPVHGHVCKGDGTVIRGDVRTRTSQRD